MSESVSGIGVLDKAVLVLDALEPGPRTLAELTTATGLPRATTHRLAVALAAHGLVRRHENGRFALGFRLAALARAAATTFPLAALARPALAALRDDTNESVQLYVREGDRRRCVESLDAPHELRTIVAVGSLLPLDRGSAGKILRGGGRGGSDRGDAAPPEHPWTESVAERAAGVASVSAPIHDDTGAVVGAVSVSGPIERTTREPGRRYGAAVVRAARAVEEAAGWR